MRAEKFLSLITPVQDRLFRFALQMTGQQALSEDILQEVFLRLWRRRDKLHEIDNFEAWCMTMTRNLCIDSLNARHRRLTALPERPEWTDTSPGPHHQAVLNQQIALVRQCLSDLPAKQQMAVHLREIEGMSYQEIADLTGESLTQIKTLIHRGRKHIRETLMKADNYGAIS